MAPVFWLEILDWKDESAEVCVSQRIIDTFFSTDWKKVKITHNVFKSLKYLDNEVQLDVSKFRLKFEVINDELNKYNSSEVLNNFIHSIDFLPKLIISTRGVISRIMNTPFEINQDKRKWIINAKIISNDCIYLYFEKDDEDNLTEAMAKQYELLKRYLFVKNPRKYYRRVISKFDEYFGELIGLNCGAHKLYYASEIPGVISDTEIIERDKLKEADHIYCDIFDPEEFSQDVINYNPIWWSNATLMNAKQCILGAYDKDNDCLKEFIQFNIDKFDDKMKYENLWSPDAAWNFLNNFLQFVQDVVHRVSIDVRKNCVWKFQSFPNDKQLVSCEIFNCTKVDGRETLVPLPENESNFP